MCGITGFIGKDAAKTALAGLAALEYRGYDSAGIAWIDGNQIRIVKTVGDVAALKAKLGKTGFSGSTTAIAHTRWATHGGVTDANAHPHADCTGKIAVIHNGIIENFQQLRTELAAKGHRFASQTDTEVISHLIEEGAKAGPFEAAGLAASRKLKGSFAFLAISSDNPETIAAAKNQTPLVFGLGEDFAYAASDPVPISPFAGSGIFLEDGDYAVATRGKIGIFGIATGKKIERLALGFGASCATASKGQYAHFMLKEIMESPAAIRNALVQDEEKMEKIASLVKANRVVFVACGTSRHAALAGRYLLNRYAGKLCEVVVASEFPYIARNLVGKDVLVVAVSQSGETADVIEGVKIAKEKGATVLSIVNAAGSTLDRLADVSLSLNCGPEIGVAATKTYASQLAIMYQIAASCDGKLDAEREKLKAIATECEKALASSKVKAEALAARLAGEAAAYFIARGPNFPTALEGALKFKEITYIHAEGMAAGELKHGTLALISKGTPVVAICPTDYTRDETISNVMETKARGAFVIGCSDESNEAFDEWVCVPKVEEKYYPLVFAGPLQLLAYHTAVLRKNNPDRPRNLAKSVTVK